MQIFEYPSYRFLNFVCYTLKYVKINNLELNSCYMIIALTRKQSEKH